MGAVTNWASKNAMHELATPKIGEGQPMVARGETFARGTLVSFLRPISGGLVNGTRLVGDDGVMRNCSRASESDRTVGALGIVNEEGGLLENGGQGAVFPGAGAVKAFVYVGAGESYSIGQALYAGSTDQPLYLVPRESDLGRGRQVGWLLEPIATAASAGAVEVSVYFDGISIGSSTGEIPDKTITRADIADPAGLQTMRWAADLPLDEASYGGPISWGPTTTTASGQRFVSQFPKGSTHVARMGSDSSGRGYVELNLASGSIGQRALSGGSSIHAPAGSYPDDGAPHQVEVILDGGTCTFRVDGELVHSEATALTVTASAANRHIGTETSASVGREWGGLLWDVEFIDPADANNSIYFRLDERSGPFYNAYRVPSDPLYNASNTAAQTATRNGGIGSVLVPTLDFADRGLTDDDLASAAVRPAAYGGGDTSSTGGRWAEATWDPSGSSIRIRAMVRFSAPHAGGAVVVSGNGSNNPRLLSNSAGGFQAQRVGGTAIGITAAGYADGQTHEVEALWEQNGADIDVSIWVDGRLVATGTEAAATLDVTSSSYYIGGAGTTSNRFPGAIWDVELIDPASAANSAFYKLDETTGAFVNSLSGSTVGNATRNGYVGSVGVLSVEGDAKPVLVGGPLIYGARLAATVSGVTGVTSWAFNGTEGEVDPTGSYNAATGVFTAPAPGRLVAAMSLGVTPTTLAGADLIRGVIEVDATRRARTWATLGSANVTVPIAAYLACEMAAGDTCSFLLDSLLSGDVYSFLEEGSVAITFIPTN